MFFFIYTECHKTTNIDILKVTCLNMVTCNMYYGIVATISVHHGKWTIIGEHACIRFTFNNYCSFS